MAYSTTKATTLATDFKIFLGKSDDINKLIEENKIVYKKWYLAYDTGEFFVGNVNGTLIQFGGNSTGGGLSEAQIIALIHQYTIDEFNEINEELLKLQEEISTLNNDLYLKIETFLESPESPTYTREYLDNKFMEIETDIDSSVKSISLNGGEIILPNESGNIDISVETVLDSELSDSSENAVQNKVITEALNDKANKSEIVGAYIFKGTKPSEADLPATGNTVGDVWDITSTGFNFAWDGKAWDRLGAIYDLSAYATKTQLSQSVASYVPLSSKGVANGVAPLDASGRIITKYLPINMMDHTSLTNRNEADQHSIHSITNLQSELDSLKATNNTLSGRIDTNANEIINNFNDIDVLRSDLDDTRTGLMGMNVNVNRALGDITDLETLTQGHSSSISTLQSDVDTAEAAIVTIDGKLTTNIQNVSLLTPRVTKNEQDIASAVGRIGVNEENIELVQTAANLSTSKLNILEPKVTTVTEDVSDLSISVGGINTSILGIDSELVNIKTRVSALEAGGGTDPGEPGTNDYSKLINKPRINNVELLGDKSLADLGIMAANQTIVKSVSVNGATAVSPNASGLVDLTVSIPEVITNHNSLLNRNMADAHSIESITGLSSRLSAVDTELDDLEASVGTLSQSSIKQAEDILANKTSIATNTGTIATINNKVGTIETNIDEIELALNDSFKSATFDKLNGKLALTKNDNTVLNVDLETDDLVNAASFDADGYLLHLTTVNGKKLSVDLSSLAPNTPVTDHRSLDHRDAAESHPISAITGLLDELTRLTNSFSEVDGKLASQLALIHTQIQEAYINTISFPVVNQAYNSRNTFITWDDKIYRCIKDTIWTGQLSEDWVLEYYTRTEVENLIAQKIQEFEEQEFPLQMRPDANFGVYQTKAEFPLEDNMPGYLCIASNDGANSGIYIWGIDYNNPEQFMWQPFVVVAPITDETLQTTYNGQTKSLKEQMVAIHSDIDTKVQTESNLRIAADNALDTRVDNLENNALTLANSGINALVFRDTQKKFDEDPRKDEYFMALIIEDNNGIEE